tara:strand:+ start:6162 stop:6620 length:459 start_codon:yes stop_codon:yes gene_type:complete
MAKAKESEETVALAVEDIKPLEYVDPEKFYYIDLQLGQSASWRTWSGKSRKVLNRPDGSFDHVHDPKVVRGIGPFCGDIVNGHISGHNDWLKRHRARREKDYRGQLDRQIIVLKTEETNNIPKESRSQSGMVPIGMIQSVVKDQMEALMGPN